jgi:Tfp pilus assembly protein PilF
MKHRAFTLLAALVAVPAGAAPYTPKNDAQVLERLPTRANDPAMADVRRLRAAVASAPGSPDPAARLALRYFEMANEQGDPRYVGYAEAALRPWAGGNAPTEVLFARGLLRQYRHDFPSALSDFATALERDPAHVGARAWRAAIFMVQADYPAAATECAQLREHASELLAGGCIAYVDATTGKARPAYEKLAATLRENRGASPQAKLWVLTRLAEIAWRLGDLAAADEHFNQALALGLDDQFLLASYADYLLERGRGREVVGLLKAWTRSDTLLLRLALAERALGMREAEPHVQALAERFAAAAVRGERLHMGEEARFLLDLKGDARGALAVAAENWKMQREPRDAAVLLEAAIAARKPKAAAAVVQWLQESGYESERLRRMAVAAR